MFEVSLLWRLHLQEDSYGEFRTGGSQALVRASTLRRAAPRYLVYLSYRDLHAYTLLTKCLENCLLQSG